MNRVLATVDIDQISNSIINKDESDEFCQNDLLHYCKNGGVIQDVILKENDGMLLLEKRIAFYSIQKELNIKLINAIIKYDNHLFIKQLVEDEFIILRNLKEEIIKEEKRANDKINEMYFFNEIPSFELKKNIIDIVCSFFGKQIVETPCFPNDNKCLQFKVKQPFSFDDKALKIDYDYFLHRINKECKIQSVNGRCYKSPYFIMD